MIKDSLDLITYPNQIHNRSRAYCPDLISVLRYQVTELIWLRYHAHLAKFGYVKCLFVLFSTLRQHIRLIWSRHGYFGTNRSR